MRTAHAFLWLVTICVSLSSAPVFGENLVINGSFEEPIIPYDSVSIQTTIPGWISTTGSGIEIQHKVVSDNAGMPYEGNQHVELDSYDSSNMFQDITTEQACHYLLTFAYSPRPGITSNEIAVLWNGVIIEVLSRSGIELADTDWEMKCYSVFADGSLTRLEFQDVGISDSFGGYIDDVKLVIDAKYSGGSGTEADPYQISTVADWQELMNTSTDWDKSFIMTADIDLAGLSETQYNPIGDYYDTPFTGNFCGNNHVIRNFHFKQEGNTSPMLAGLFGATGTESIIENLGVEDFQLSSNVDGAGGLVGFNYGLINSCYTIGKTNCTSNSGGLVGWNHGTIINCYSGGEIAGSGSIGGLVGNNYYGKIENSFSSSIISGGGCVGGLVASNTGLIVSCYSTGAVSGSGIAGGLCGTNYFGTDDDCDLCGTNNSGTIINCYATGAVSSESDYVGGLCGWNNYGTITGCYATGMVMTPRNALGGLCGISHGTISDSYATGSVTGGPDSYYLGGLCGSNGSYGLLGGTISNCFAIGTVTGGNNSGFLGGLVGRNVEAGNITSSYAFGSVGGHIYIGGLVGGNAGTVNYSYAAGSVTDSDSSIFVGGLCGAKYDGGGTIGSCFWDTQTSGQTTSDGGTGKTTAQMQTLSTFTDAGWNFVTDWMICDGVSYPHLQWEAYECPQVLRYDGGSGTLEDPYQIRTAEQLSILALHPDDWGKHFKLIANIDLRGDAYKNLHIGQYAEVGDPNYLPFLGSFDGNGKTLSNYRYAGDDAPDCVGLFSYLGPGGQIRNLTLEGVEIATSRSSYVGGLVGLNDNGTVSGCRVQCKIVGKDVVGGIVGLNWQATVSGCRVMGEVQGQQSIGGLVGYGYGGSTILDCIFQGVATGNSTMGGIAGGSEELSQIKRCYSTGLVRGDSFVGGIAGANYNSMIEDSGSLCDVIGEGFLGGLVGVSDYGASVARSYSAGVVSCSQQPSGGLIGQGNRNVTDSFWDIQTSTQSTSVGGTGKSTAEMRSAATFTDAGWDFVGESANGAEDIWKIREGLSYPRFASLQESPYDFAGDYGVSLQEFAILAENWQTSGCSGHGFWCGGADLDHSGSVDLADLLIVAENWLK